MAKLTYNLVNVWVYRGNSKLVNDFFCTITLYAWKLDFDGNI